MKVIEYLKEHGLQKLNEEFGVISKIYSEGLIVLNYDQINSPKNVELVKECRGLILDDKFNVVSRSFDRFFNYGEMETDFNVSTSVLHEKVDGSLIKIYNWNGNWYISTRGTAFAESKVNGWDLTFKDMVLRALKVGEEEYQKWFDDHLDKDCTYIFEVTGVENRVVTQYQGYTLWFLAVRNNKTGKYHSVGKYDITNFGAVWPNKFKFSSVEECIETSKSLPDLQEGYVAYENGVPICKIKSPAYVAVHHIRGEGLNPKRIAELVVINEQDEYLKYFPEDENHFTPYIECLGLQLALAERLYQEVKVIEDQKSFALKVKDSPFNFLLFKARKENNHDIRKVFNSLDTNLKVKFLLGVMGGKDA